MFADPKQPKFVIKHDNAYFILSQEEALTVLNRGKQRQSLNITDFAVPIDETAALLFVQKSGIRPLALLDHNKDCDPFWDLMFSAVKSHED